MILMDGRRHLGPKGPQSKSEPHQGARVRNNPGACHAYDTEHPASMSKKRNLAFQVTGNNGKAWPFPNNPHQPNRPPVGELIFTTPEIFAYGFRGSQAAPARDLSRGNEMSKSLGCGACWAIRPIGKNQSIGPAQGFSLYPWTTASRHPRPHGAAPATHPGLAG